MQILFFPSILKNDLPLHTVPSHTPDTSYFLRISPSFHYCDLFVRPDLRKNNILSLFTLLSCSFSPFCISSPLFLVSQDQFTVCCCCNLEAKHCVKITVTGQSCSQYQFTVSHFQVLQCPSLILSICPFQLITLPFNSFLLTVPVLISAYFFCCVSHPPFLFLSPFL